MCKITVIVPIYKVEKYIEKCARSLFEQSLDDIEYIFINDCSPDKSLDILNKVIEQYPLRKEQTIVISNDSNIGVGQSRQRGIDLARGKYVIHCDPDDWVDCNMYQLMYDCIESSDADIVICDYFREGLNQEIVTNQIIPESKELLFKAIANDKLYMTLWNKLIRADLVKQFSIEQGIDLWEDMSIMIPMIMQARKVAYVAQPLYHYRINNSNSIVHNISEKATWSMIKAVEVIGNYLGTIGIQNSIRYEDLVELQWRSKIGLILNYTSQNRNQWMKIYPDSTKYKYLSNLNLKGKVMTWCMVHNSKFLLQLILLASKLMRTLKNR